MCGFSSSGRAPPCQGGGSEFDPRNPLLVKNFHFESSFLLSYHRKVLISHETRYLGYTL